MKKYTKELLVTGLVLFNLFSFFGRSYSQTDNSIFFGADSSYIATASFDTVRDKAYTVECWFKMQSDSADQVLYDFGSDTSNFFSFNLNSSYWGNPVFTLVKDDWKYYQQLGVSLPENLWTHLSVSLKVAHASTYIKIYVNGVLVSGKSYSSDLSLSLLTDNYIGRSRKGKIFRNGLMDEFRIWNTCLTDNEVAELYKQGLESQGEDFWIYYPLDKDESDLDTVYDASVNNYGGKIDRQTTDTWPTDVWSGQDSSIYYVTTDGTGDGTSWDNATSDLQAAIDACASDGLGEVWVKAGTYYPLYQYDGNSDNDQKKSFVLKNGVNIYGGFAGTETDKDQRDIDAHVTILSGDIGTVGDTTDNVYHIVYADNVLSDYGISNVVITYGHAFGEVSTIDENGGGAYLNGGRLSYCTVQHNKASKGGGGIFVSGVGRVEHTSVDSNYSAFTGGGITASYGGFIDHCSITTNKTKNYGGGVFLKNEGTLSNSTLMNNSGYNGGGLYQTEGGTVYNNVFSNNNATWGGGANFQDCSSTNNTFVFNSSSNGGGALANTATLSNSLFWGNEASYSAQLYNVAGLSIVQYCAIEDYELTNNNNISLDEEYPDSIPDFLSPITYTGLADNQEELDAILSADYRLQQGSICIGKGSDSLAWGIDFDATGNDRIIYDTIDIGAYEAMYASATIKDSVLVYSGSAQVPQEFTTVPAGLGAKVVSVKFLTGSSTESINADLYFATIEIEDDAYVGLSYDTFRIAKAEQTITFDSIDAKGEEDENFVLQAVSTSQLPISFTSGDEQIAVIVNDSVVDILNHGTVVITASQEGNDNYYAATPVERILLIEEGSAVETLEKGGIKVYPNPSLSGTPIKVSIDDLTGSAQYYLYNHSGQLVQQKEEVDNNFYLPLLSPGMYILRIDFNQNTYQTKLIVN